MTSPGGGTPAGGVSGGGGMAAHAAKTQAQWKDSINSQVGGKFGGINAFGTLTRDRIAHIPSLVDGQDEYKDRIELLEGVRGYCSTVQGQTWFLGDSPTLKKLPMETQVGPAVGATPYDGGIRAEELGLWRFDALATFDPPNRRGGGGTYWYSVKVALAIVVMSGGSLYSRKIVQRTLNGPYPDSAGFPGDPEGVFFSHTVVIPTNGTHTAYAYVKQEGALNSLVTKYRILGGTETSGLWATKLDFRTDNNVVAPTVPDGGDL